MAGSLETTATLPGAEEGSGRALPLNEQAPGFHLQDYQKKRKKKIFKNIHERPVSESASDKRF